MWRTKQQISLTPMFYSEGVDMGLVLKEADLLLLNLLGTNTGMEDSRYSQRGQTGTFL